MKIKNPLQIVKFQFFNLIERVKISVWLESMNIKNYKIKKDLSVDVFGSVYICHDKLDKIPVHFDRVSGHFDCSQNCLTSLKGAPQFVGGSFDCSGNQLMSLEHSPQSVGYCFNCSHNRLTGLEYCPKHVSLSFNCSNNPLLGDTQNLTDFDDIYSIHQELAKIKKEKDELLSSLSVCKPHALKTHKI